MSISRVPFIAVGTGRCGTNSLQRILHACKNTRVWHEGFQVHWYKVTDELGKMIKTFRDVSKKGLLAGDVAQATIMHIGELRSSFPEMPVICLHRDKNEVVRSFMDYNSTVHMLRPMDKRAWVEKGPNVDGRFARAVHCFPVIDAVNPEQAYGFYWEMYEALMAKISHPVMHVNTKELNDDAVLHRIFEFLGIPESDMVYIDKRKHWTREETQAIQMRMTRARAGQYVEPEIIERSEGRDPGA